MSGLLERLARRRHAPGSNGRSEVSTFAQRGRIRRRVRYLQRLREVEFRDLGGFLVELHRFGVERPELVRAKLAAAARTDQELRGLRRALGAKVPVRELREAGIGGSCEQCGAVHGSEDRFCASCGARLSHRPGPARDPARLGRAGP